MFAMTLDAPAGGTQRETIDRALEEAHDRWVQQAGQFLMPAAEGGEFWDRWAAVRYLADQFVERYSRERAFTEELHPFLTPHESERIRYEAERVARLRLELDRLGRRRGTAPEVAAAARELLDHLRLWCTEIEIYGSRIPREALSAEGARLLDLLDVGLLTVC
jgi:hypothetical protein